MLSGNDSNISMADYQEDFDHMATCKILEEIISKQNNMYLERSSEQTVLFTLYGTLIVLGVIGNIFVISIIMPSSRLRNLRNCFVVHLAFSDLVLCLLTAPMTLYLTMNNFWEFGDLSCKLVASVQAMNTFLSLLTLTAIGLDRYLLVIFPIRWRTQKKALILILTAVWAISLAVAAPYFFAVGTIEAHYGIWNLTQMDFYLHICERSRPQLCVELFRGKGLFSKRTFTIIIFIAQYLFPLSGLLFVYSNIAKRTLRQRKSRRNQDQSGQVCRLAEVRKRRKRTIILLTSLVIVFGVCWLPSNLYCALEALDALAFDQYVYIYWHLIGMATTCINPLLYGFLNSNVRKAISVMVRSWPCFWKNRSARSGQRLLHRMENQNRNFRLCSEPNDPTMLTKISRRTFKSAKSAGNLIANLTNLELEQMAKAAIEKQKRAEKIDKKLQPTPPRESNFTVIHNVYVL